MVRLVSPKQLAAVPGLLAESRRLHDELRTLGVHIPRCSYLVGSPDPATGDPHGFIVADRVAGRPLRDAIADPAFPAIGAVDDLCTRLLDYFWFKYDQGGRYLPDITIDQFMHGHVGQADCLFFVDLDPGFVEIPARPTDGLSLAALHWRVAHVVEAIRATEAARGVRLGRARDRLRDLSAGPLFSHPSAKDRPGQLWAALDTGIPFDGHLWMDDWFD